MVRHRQAVILLIAAGTLALPSGRAFGQVADPDPARFAEAIQAFTDYDRQNVPPADGVLFVGSSSIVRWSTAEVFPDLPVINRGFGGSHISDVNHFVQETVLRHSPALVVFYAGNNDVQNQKTPEQVFEDYREFVGAVRDGLPETHILFISLHPSLARWARWSAMKELNALVREYSAAGPNLHYVDISEAMLGADGTPIPELFVQDGLHLTPAGYDVWNPIVAQAIDSVLEHAGQ